MRPVLLALISTASLSACGFDISAPGFKRSEKGPGGGGSAQYSYDFSENGCDTGRKSFDDKGTYCSTLQDNAANNNCAADLRNTEYNDNCK